MKKTTAKRSSLFLLELIIAILFFALASAVCVQLFAEAHLQSQETKVLTMSLAKATEMAEAIQSTDGSIDSILPLFPDAAPKKDGCTLYYDVDFSPCDADRAVYQLCLTLKIQEPEHMETGSIEVKTLSGERIYQLDVRKYLGTDKGAES